MLSSSSIINDTGVMYQSYSLVSYPGSLRVTLKTPTDFSSVTRGKPISLFEACTAATAWRWPFGFRYILRPTYRSKWKSAICISPNGGMSSPQCICCALWCWYSAAGCWITKQASRYHSVQLRLFELSYKQLYVHIRPGSNRVHEWFYAECDYQIRECTWTFEYHFMTSYIAEMDCKIHICTFPIIIMKTMLHDTPLRHNVTTHEGRSHARTRISFSML